MRWSFVLFALTVAVPQQSIPIGMPNGREFTIRIDPAVAATSCNVQSFQTGGFGGHGGPAARSSGAGVFTIPTGVGDKPAKTLKVAVWCRGSGMALIDEPVLESSSFERTVRLSPLRDVPLSGRLLPSLDGTNLAGATIHVSYMAGWLCGFFNLVDCLVPNWEIASGSIAEGGTFRVLVPDFAQDPVITRGVPAAISDPGELQLRVERSTAPYDFRLELEGAAFGLLRVAANYPPLTLKPRRQ